VAFSFPSLLCGLSVQMTTAVAALESPYWLHPSQMRFAVFDSPALIRGRCQVAFSFPSLLCGLSVPMTTAVAVVGITLQTSSFANALRRF
jgi:hypothetical protein